MVTSGQSVVKLLVYLGHILGTTSTTNIEMRICANSATSNNEDIYVMIQIC